MPIYEYQCAACGAHHETIQKMSEGPLKKCPACGKLRLKRLISAPVFRLKGGGWYETDFKSDAESKRNLHAEEKTGKAEATDKAAAQPKDGGDAAPKADAKGEAKVEAKGETKSESKAEGAAAAKADSGKGERKEPAKAAKPATRRSTARRPRPSGNSRRRR